MPIKVACSCGAKFNAKDELAGKTVKCPKCEIPLKIPAATPQSATPQAQQQAPKPAAPAQPAPQAKPAGDDIFGLAPQEGNRNLMGDPFMSELLAEAGVMADPNYRGPRCPGCNAPIKEGAVLCVKCGFDMRTGHRIKSEIGPGSEFAHLSHGANAEELIKKAEKEIAETPFETQENPGADNLMAFLIAGGLMVGLVVVVGLGYLLFRFIDVRATNMSSIAFIMFLFGAPMVMIGRVWMIVIAFMEDTVQGVLVLLIDCYAIFYGFTHMSTCSIPVVMYVVGAMMLNAAWVMLMIGDEESVQRPPVIERTFEEATACLPTLNSPDTLPTSALALPPWPHLKSAGIPVYQKVSSCELPPVHSAALSLSL